jgi:hypothetical protein
MRGGEKKKILGVRIWGQYDERKIWGQNINNWPREIGFDGL